MAFLSSCWFIINCHLTVCGLAFVVGGFFAGLVWDADGGHLSVSSFSCFVWFQKLAYEPCCPFSAWILISSPISMFRRSLCAFGMVITVLSPDFRAFTEIWSFSSFWFM